MFMLKKHKSNYSFYVSFCYVREHTVYNTWPNAAQAQYSRTLYNDGNIYICTLQYGIH